ncbi:unnamed protein product [Orchesella dallaii]|uniref:Uncharacterized protein n=1 Tax=Orchesella dallaii TaxID=48710 RepID=A0ABP1S650_9HEXA
MQSQSRRSAGLRTPRATETVERGLGREFKVSVPVPQSSEDFIKKFGPLSVEVQQALTAILMLESPEYNIVIDSLNALQKFCKRRDENKEMYVELGGLPPIQKRMFDPNAVIQRMSMKLLALTSTVHKTKLFIRNLDVIFPA